MIFLCLVITTTNCYHVECNFHEETGTLDIVGLRSMEDFEHYGEKCGDYDLDVLIYDKCYIGKIILPLRTIVRNYARLRFLYWNCEGDCDYSDSTVTVIGCTSGKRYDTFILSSRSFRRFNVSRYM